MKIKEMEKRLTALQNQIEDIQKNSRQRSLSQQRADKKYKASLYPHNLRFTKYEKELNKHLVKQVNKTHYLKNLIAKDMGFKSYSDFIKQQNNKYLPSYKQKKKVLQLRQEGY